MDRQKRRPGEAARRESLFAKIDPSVKAKVNAVADALGISQARALELMLASVDVDANGRPGFYEGELPTDSQEELPMASAS